MSSYRNAGTIIAINTVMMRAKTSKTSQNNLEAGFSLMELIVAMGLAAVLMGLALFDTQEYANRALTTASALEGHLKTVRAKGLATTYAYTLSATSANLITASYSPTCNSAVLTPDPDMNFTLPTGTQISNFPWTFCFTSRGLADSSLNIIIQDSTSSKTVQVVLGGAVRLL